MDRLIKFLGGGCVVVLLISTGLFFYTHWNQKRFDTSLLKKNGPGTYTHTAKKRHASESPSDPQGSTPQRSEVLLETEAPLTQAENEGTTENENAPGMLSPEGNFQVSFSESPAEVEAASRVPSPIAAEDTEDAPEVPYDLEVARAGFDDYNMYLETAPEYAYQRLDDAFREQYGDSSDVDTLIRTIRRTNEGTATLNDAIENAEAFLRLATRISPEEALHPIRRHHAELVELRQAAHEEGTELPIYSQTHVFDPTH